MASFAIPPPPPTEEGEDKLGHLQTTLFHEEENFGLTDSEVEVLCKGSVFKKLHRFGASKFRKIWFSSDLQKIFWGVNDFPKKQRTFSIKQQSTGELFTRTKGEMCVSTLLDVVVPSTDSLRICLTGTERSLDLEASSVAQRDAWVTSIKKIISSVTSKRTSSESVVAMNFNPLKHTRSHEQFGSNDRPRSATEEIQSLNSSLNSSLSSFGSRIRTTSFGSMSSNRSSKRLSVGNSTTLRMRPQTPVQLTVPLDAGMEKRLLQLVIQGSCFLRHKPKPEGNIGSSSKVASKPRFVYASLALDQLLWCSDSMSRGNPMGSIYVQDLLVRFSITILRYC